MATPERISRMVRNPNEKNRGQLSVEGTKGAKASNEAQRAEKQAEAELEARIDIGWEEKQRKDAAIAKETHTPAEGRKSEPQLLAESRNEHILSPDGEDPGLS